MNADEVLADIITNELEIDPSRVVLYDQNFKAPKDQDLYVTIATGPTQIIGGNQKFEPADPEADPPTVDREVKTVVKATTYNVEMSSKNEDAKYRNHEIIMAITSNDAQQKMEENNIAIFRTGQILDLSLIEGTSALHRFRIPVIIHSIERKEKAIEVYDSFQAPQEEINVP